MKKRKEANKRVLWRDVLDWLRMAVKTLWRKLLAKGKTSESFPKEGPH